MKIGDLRVGFFLADPPEKGTDNINSDCEAYTSFFISILEIEYFLLQIADATAYGE